mmetsp:Transcript_32791/g.101664  ORF Transcript_32791/g.101664 Transcript_32791/m.101664 type:complete len:226 (-) Transcript_32791:23-700(-)
MPPCLAPALHGAPLDGDAAHCSLAGRRPRAVPTALLPDEREKLPPMDPGPGVVDDVNSIIPLHREYSIIVDTGTQPDSETTGDVLIQLIGGNRRSGLIHLKKGFRRGQRYEFSVFSRDVGRVERIRLVADTPDRWFCDRVYLKQPQGLTEFPVGQSIGWPNNPEVEVEAMMRALGPGSAALAVVLQRALRGGGSAELQARCAGRRRSRHRRCAPRASACRWRDFL